MGSRKEVLGGPSLNASFLRASYRALIVSNLVIYDVLEFFVLSYYPDPHETIAKGNREQEHSRNEHVVIVPHEQRIPVEILCGNCEINGNKKPSHAAPH